MGLHQKYVVERAPAASGPDTGIIDHLATETNHRHYANHNRVVRKTLRGNEMCALQNHCFIL